ncbi:alpha/beta fold hydrolase [Kitasatospora sp. McL0602]|uniref:alpha/beta fold hydrolase n=1 Tax=Kitasatospora sp. McL0602 TaxID=3439530 RepID=UPI003F88EDAC
MTAFVLVSGSYTGGSVWQEVAAGLRAAGAEVHPVTLTGMGDSRHLAGPDTGLETHVEDLVQLLDRLETPEVVIVGHDYGIHPVLGAADRRPERIARIVHLDAGIPLDGESVLDLLPDPAIREALVQQAEDGWRIAPPTAAQWPMLGSTAGLTAEALDTLTRQAAPQPLGTLTQPLRLTGAAADVPTSGILCTGNGMSIGMVETVLGMGDPRLQKLVDPRVGFFELATGHWPMLSVPEELTEVLLRAAAGEGHRLAVRTDELPAHLQPFLLDVPELERERVGQVDLYLPEAAAATAGPRPAVVFVHGGPVPAGVQPTPRDWPALVGYARYVASLGAVGVTLDHPLHSLSDYPQSAEAVAAAVELVRADPRVDGERVAVWIFSGGGLLSADWLGAPPQWLRCLALTYPVLAPLPGWGMGETRFRPAAAVASAGRLPVVLTRVELEVAEIAGTVAEFLAAAEAGNADVEVVDVPGGHHGFETIDHTDEARRAVERAVGSVLAHLEG